MMRFLADCIEQNPMMIGQAGAQTGALGRGASAPRGVEDAADGEAEAGEC